MIFTMRWAWCEPKSCSPPAATTMPTSSGAPKSILAFRKRGKKLLSSGGMTACWKMWSVWCAWSGRWWSLRYRSDHQRPDHAHHTDHIFQHAVMPPLLKSFFPRFRKAKIDFGAPELVGIVVAAGGEQLFGSHQA